MSPEVLAKDLPGIPVRHFSEQLLWFGLQAKLDHDLTKSICFPEMKTPGSNLGHTSITRNRNFNSGIVHILAILFPTIFFCPSSSLIFINQYILHADVLFHPDSMRIQSTLLSKTNMNQAVSNSYPPILCIPKAIKRQLCNAIPFNPHSMTDNLPRSWWCINLTPFKKQNKILLSSKW